MNTPMRIRILGGGWYGCHVALHLRRLGHEVELHEIGKTLFAGASGGNPARLHIGPHYPRSQLTRRACQEHHALFMANYGHLTRGVRSNVYAVEANDSLVDFGTYLQVLKGEIEFIVSEDPKADLELHNVEGAILTGERHIVIEQARSYFLEELRRAGAVVLFEQPPGGVDQSRYDWNIDCTFCANDAAGVHRYEPCITALLAGPTDRAVTIMDGPFPSIYPWDEDRGLCSLTSARWTPLATCSTYPDAAGALRCIDRQTVDARVYSMRQQMAHYWPASWDLFKLADVKLTIRAMPRSGAAARLVEVVRVGKRALRIRAGKIDAIFHAANLVDGFIHNNTGDIQWQTTSPPLPSSATAI